MGLPAARLPSTRIPTTGLSTSGLSTRRPVTRRPATPGLATSVRHRVTHLHRVMARSPVMALGHGRFAER